MGTRRGGPSNAPRLLLLLLTSCLEWKVVAAAAAAAAAAVARDCFRRAPAPPAPPDTAKFGRFHRGMLEHGVYLAPSQFEAGFTSLAHTDADIDRTIEAARSVLKSL